MTLPIEFRRRYRLKKDDVVLFKETEDGILVISRETLVMRLLDEIGVEFQQRGVTLEDRIESGREIRQQIYDETYSQDPDAE